MGTMERLLHWREHGHTFSTAEIFFFFSSSSSSSSTSTSTSTPRICRHPMLFDHTVGDISSSTGRK